MHYRSFRIQSILFLTLFSLGLLSACGGDQAPGDREVAGQPMAGDPMDGGHAHGDHMAPTKIMAIRAMKAATIIRTITA